jgi:RNA polymerase sigma factor (sigma-70 family)
MEPGANPFSIRLLAGLLARSGVSDFDSGVNGNGAAAEPTAANWNIPADDELAQLYRSHSSQLVSTLARRTDCLETARDIAQESFARLLSVPRSARLGIRKPEAYLRRISTNLLRDWGRAQSVRRRDLPSDRADPPQVNQVAALESRDALRRLEAAMLKLKPRTREIFMAHRIDGLSYAEIAEQTGLSVKGVEKQMGKAIAMIDRLLDRS